MKNLISLFLALSLATAPVTVVANSPMDSANEIVQSSLMAARSDALALLKLDLQNSVIYMANELATLGDFEAITQSLLTSNQLLEESFSDLASKDASALALTKAQTWDFYNQYKTLVRDRFRNSFVPADVRFSLNRVMTAIDLIADDFKRTCDEGKSIKEFVYASPRLPDVPEMQFNLFIKYGASFNESDPQNAVGSNGAYGVDYKMASASESQTLKDLQGAGTVLQATTGLATSFAIAGSTNTAFGAALVEGAAVAVPYLIVAVVVLAIVTQLIARKEQSRMETEMSNAQLHIFRKTAKGDDVIGFYKEQCSDAVTFLDQVNKIILNLKKGEAIRKPLYQKAVKTRKARTEWQEAAFENQKRADRITLFNLHKENLCLINSSLKAKQAIKAEKPHCVIGKNKIYFSKHVDVSLPVDEEERRKTYFKLKSEMQSFQAKYTEEKVTAFMLDQIVEVLSPRLDIVNSSLKAIAWNHLDREQAAAFQNLIQVLGIYRKNLESENPAAILINAELALVAEFTAFKSEYIDLVALAIKHSFRHISKTEFISKVDDFQIRFETFRRNYFHVPAVRTLKNNVDALFRFKDQL